MLISTGDERPCQRCIKRGLQNACQDGVRKKAKYLHDAPDGALIPGVGGNFYNSSSNNGNVALSNTGANGAVQQQQQNNGASFYATPQSGSYNVYPETSMGQSPFTTQSPASPTYNVKSGAAGRHPSLSSSTVSQQPTGTTSQAQNPFAGPLFDPSDPALFNFDLSSMNFENRYGALEFGMLGHMATGAGDSPSDSATQRGSIGGGGGSIPFSAAAGTGYGDTSSPGNTQPFVFGADPLLNDWPNGQASGQHVNVNGMYQNNIMTGPMPASKPDAPHAFAIESGPASFTSPSSISSPQVAASLEDNTFNAMNNGGKSNGLPANGQRSVVPASGLKQQHTGAKKRHRNPSAIYESVKEPYPYTSGFHNLTAFIQHRFPPQKRLQIAKSLASIRPSLIATSKTLNRDDLIFMEKCFQRTLWEYEDFINACGTPTLVMRRTGEVAAVGKEFSILTGWKKEVLLGKEPNLNVNTGGSGPHLGALSRGAYTQRNASMANGNHRTQPVFLAELLDDESVVEFYDDFARLAFGDSRGSVMTTCKLLKYKTKEEMEIAQAEDSQNWNGHLRKGGIAGEAGMNQLGSKDGKVECAYCWTVKRDVFDIPMLIVMNVSAFCCLLPGVSANFVYSSYHVFDSVVGSNFLMDQLDTKVL